MMMMVMKKMRITILLGLFCVFQINGQDVFLAQFYANPHTLNPALTGLYAGDMRINLDYRDQKQSLVPIEVQAASFDMKLLRKQNKDYILAVGGSYLSENQANGLLQSNSALFSAALHLPLGINKKHYLSTGIQAGILQSKLDVHKLTFNNQYDQINKQFDPDIASGMDINADQYVAMDMNAGLIWYYLIAPGVSFFTGITAFHLILPESPFIQNANAINRKYLLHIGTRYPVNEQLVLIPNIFLFNQNNHLYSTSGTALEYRLSENFGIRGGAWYRHNDNMIIGSAGITINQLKIIFSYDMYSEMLATSSTRGGMEISLEYVMQLGNIVTLQPNPGVRY
jgi:type IX secretion system PorP/SprF family membrane protein